MKLKILEWLFHLFFPGCHIVTPCDMGTIPYTKTSVATVVFVYKCIVHDNEEFFLYTSEGIDQLQPMDGIKFSFEDGK
jgi:hypothetical protein